MSGAPYKSVQGEGGALLSVSHLSGHVMFTATYSLSSKQIIGQRITYNKTTNGFEVESWWHTTLWMAPCHCERRLARGAYCIGYIHLCIDAFSEVLHTKFLSLPQICIALEAVLLKIHECTHEAHSRVSAHLSKLWSYTGNGPKIGVGALLWDRLW